MTFFRNHFTKYFCIVFFKPCQCQGVTALKVIYYISFMKSHKHFLSQEIAREMVFQMLLFLKSLQLFDRSSYLLDIQQILVIPWHVVLRDRSFILIFHTRDHFIHGNANITPFWLFQSYSIATLSKFKFILNENMNAQNLHHKI